MIYLELFLSFLQVGAFSVGGGYAAIPLIQNLAVEKYGWLTLSEFTDLVTIAEMTPGPIAVNAATFVGTQTAGTLGAIIATLGCILPSCIIVSVLAYVYYRFRKLSMLGGVLASLRPVVVALIASAGITILLQVIFGGNGYLFSSLNYLGIVLFAAALFVLRKFKCNPILVMSLCGVAGLAYGIIADFIK
jgi:chromate transporter